MNGKKILNPLDLAGCMTPEGFPDLTFLNSGSVIRHADHIDTAAADFHGDRIGTGINGIFHKFLYHTCGSFHHFSGSDLINRILIKLMNFCHCSYHTFSGHQPDIASFFQRFFSSF